MKRESAENYIKRFDNEKFEKTRTKLIKEQ